MGCSKSSSNRENYSNTSLPQKSRKTTREEQTKPKVGRRKEIIKIKAEMKQKQKRFFKKKMKLRAGSLKR